MKRQGWIRILMLVAWVVIMYFGTTAYHELYSSYPKDGKERQTDYELWTRSFFSSVQLFAFNIDSNAVDGWKQEAEKENTQVSDRLHTSAICAGIWTVFFIGLLLFKSWWMWIVRHLYSRWIRKDLFVFWGINRRSIQLAHELGKDVGWRNVLFIVQPEKEYEDTTEGLKFILQRSKYRDALKQQIGSRRVSILIAKRPIAEFSNVSYCSTWRKMGLGLMVRYIMRTTRHIHVLLLGNNEEQNMYDALKLSSQSLWPTFFPFKSRELTIHCLARRNNANRVIEDVTNSNVIEMVDSSHLAIELLKKEPKNHPVRFVDIKRGVVSSSFNSLIIGFSETGQDALRFLYEFSAFVDAKSKEQEDIRSPFRCYIVDKQLSPSAARWMHHAKGMFDQRNNDGSKCITFNPKMDYNSSEFYSEVLDKIIDDLNYVVIAIGDDQAGITLAVDILRYAIKTGRVKSQQAYYSSKEKFRIYVRSYDPNMCEYLKTIASHYNEEAEYITIFGAEQELYTKQMLIDESLLESAKAYQLHYEEAYRIHHDHNNDKMSEQECKQLWSNRRKKLFAQTPKLQGTLDLRRKESQDYANALHLETKKCLKLYGTTPLRLAQTEHLRWIAAHEIMGYSSYCPNGEDKDLLHYGHRSMIPWKKLKGDTREYDFLTFNELFSQECLSTAISKAKKDAYDYKK